MMKNSKLVSFISLVLVFVMAFSMAGCNNNTPGETTTPPTETTAGTESPTEGTEATDATEETTEPVIAAPVLPEEVDAPEAKEEAKKILVSKYQSAGTDFSFNVPDIEPTVVGQTSLYSLSDTQLVAVTVTPQHNAAKDLNFAYSLTFSDYISAVADRFKISVTMVDSYNVVKVNDIPMLRQEGAFEDDSGEQYYCVGYFGVYGRVPFSVIGAIEDGKRNEKSEQELCDVIDAIVWTLSEAEPLPEETTPPTAETEAADVSGGHDAVAGE